MRTFVKGGCPITTLPAHLVRLFGGGIRFEAEDGLVRFGIAKALPGEAFDGLGVVTQGIEIQLQLTGDGFLGVQLSVQFLDFPAHALIFLDFGQVSHADEQQSRQRNQRDDRLRQPAPDAKINFLLHHAS